ncbi:MAG: hypothetical protein U0V87_10375 [Acidobacteriota bacterium]
MRQDRAAAIRVAVLLWCGAALAAAAPFAGLGRYSAAIVAGVSAFWFLHVMRPQGVRFVAAVLVVWAFTHSAAVIGLTLWSPERAGAVIPHGVEYWSEMRPFVVDGSGVEADPYRFVPLHLRHLLGFAVLSAISGGLAGLVLGAFLTGYMSYYVAQVMTHASHPLIAGLLAWHPWAVIRVVGFILLGISLSRLWPERKDLAGWWRTQRGQLALALGLWSFDLILKTALAPWWSALLRTAGGVRITH